MIEMKLKEWKVNNTQTKLKEKCGVSCINKINIEP
jgi:hypothetical protein